MKTLTATPTLELFELALDPTPDHESYSPFCLKVHRALKAADLPYTRTALDMPSRTTPFNKAGQVPVLRIDARHVADSTPILAAINTLTDGMFTLHDPRADAEARLWEDWADTVLSGFVSTARWADEDNWSRVRPAYFPNMPAPVALVVPAMIRRSVLKGLHARELTRRGLDACWERLEHTLDDLERRAPQRGFWMGDKLSVADLAIFAQLHSLRTELTPAQRDAVNRRPALTAWMELVARATTLPLLRSVA